MNLFPSIFVLCKDKMYFKKLIQNFLTDFISIRITFYIICRPLDFLRIEKSQTIQRLSFAYHHICFWTFDIGFLFSTTLGCFSHSRQKFYSTGSININHILYNIVRYNDTDKLIFLLCQMKILISHCKD